MRGCQSASFADNGSNSVWKRSSHVWPSHPILPHCFPCPSDMNRPYRRLLGNPTPLSSRVVTLDVFFPAHNHRRVRNVDIAFFPLSHLVFPCSTDTDIADTQLRLHATEYPGRRLHRLPARTPLTPTCHCLALPQHHHHHHHHAACASRRVRQLHLRKQLLDL